MAKKVAAILLIAAAVLGLVSASLADQGTATYYTVYTPSACYGFQDEGTMIAAASDSLWNGGAACGRMYTVSCAGGTNATPNPPARAAASPSRSSTGARRRGARPRSTSPRRPSTPSETSTPARSSSTTTRCKREQQAKRKKDLRNIIAYILDYQE
ncbi:unnamed protein product [Urochloa humidicola]